MKRKFISALLFGATIMATTSTFVACKDYDDDITELRSLISTDASDLTALIDKNAKSVKEQISALDEQGKSLEEAYKLADQALQDAIAKAKAEAVADASDKAAAAEAAAKSYANVQAEEARKAAVAEALEMVNAAKAELQGKLDAANALIAEAQAAIAANKSAIDANKSEIEANKAAISALIAADVELQKGITAAQARADEAYSLANAAKEIADKNSADIATLQTKLAEVAANLDAVKTALEGRVTVLEGQVSTLLAKAEAQATEIASLEGQLKSLKESNDKAIAELQGKDAELEALIKKNNDEITKKLDSEVAALKTEAANNLKEAKAYTDALRSYVDGQLNTLKGDITSINTSISELKTAYANADKALQKNIDDLKTNLEGQIAALKTAQSTTDSNQDQKITALETTLKALENGDIKKFADKVNTMDGNITTLQGDVLALNNSLALETKRLKGLVFAPTAFVDGIECIQFTTLRYQDWTNNTSKWEANAAVASNPYYVIDDAQHTEEWIVNPKNAKLSDITSLSFVSNTATNLHAVSQTAPIAVAEMPTVINNGVMKLKLKKTTTNSFGTDRNNFTIVALKATLSDDLLTDAEKAAGEKAEVYSDWARLYETSVTPKIHNKLATSESSSHEITLGNGVTETETYAHFWNYGDAYNNSGKTTTLGSDYNYRHIAKSVYYEESIDLNTLVEVCDPNTGKKYDAENYGLKFYFYLMDYKLQNLGGTTDVTNQKNFAKLTDGHILTSTDGNGGETKRNAIGKQPMIQVVLKDIRSGESNAKVVDVRYFKIQWTDKEVYDVFGSIGDFSKNYVCAGDVSQVVGEQMVNSIYAHYNMTRSEFHNSYDLNTTLFATEAAAKAGTPVKANLGTITDLTDWADPGQTHNLKWTISTRYNVATQAEYNAGKKVITAYGYFQSKTNPNSKIVFSLKLTLNIAKMGYAATVGKDQAMWKDGARTVNPVLVSDPTYGSSAGYVTTMIRGNLLKGYLKNGVTPRYYTDLVNTATDDAKFKFDSSKLSALASATGTTASKWTVSANGLTLSYNGVVAATINATDGTVKLQESNDGQAGSTPTSAAKLLVGHSAPVKLEGEFCDLIDNIDAYNVNFLAPLTITSASATRELVDMTSGGSATASLAGTIEIKEAFPANPVIVWNNNAAGNNPVNNTALVAWYGVQTPVYDVANAKTNIQKNGTIGSSCNVKLSDIKNADNTVKYSVGVNGTGASTTVTFNNLSGNAIGQSFKIEIPVNITTKWQSMSAKVVVVVKPNI